jgi:hypothetical protein
MSKPLSKTVYTNRFNAIRKYVNFRMSKNPTKSEKAKITRYFNAAKLYGVIGEPRPGVSVFSTKDAEKLAAAKEAAGMDGGFPGFKVAIFQNVTQGMRKVARKKDGKWVFFSEGEHRREEIYLFADFERYVGEFAQDPEAVAARVLKKIKSADVIRFLTGEWISKGYVSGDALLAEVGRFKAQYGESSRENAEDRYQNWLRGVIAVWFRAKGKKKGKGKTETERQKYFRGIRDEAGRRRQRDRIVAQFWDLLRGGEE